MGGIETHLQTLCNQLIRTTEVRVIVSNDDPGEKDDCVEGVRVKRVPTPFTLASAPICPAMVSAIRSSGADLVHIHLPNPTAVLAYLASGHQGPLVVTYHSDTVRQRFLGALFEPMLHRFLNRATAIIATSPQYLATSPVLRRHRDRCIVVPYGIQAEQFAMCDPARVAPINAEFGSPLILAVGRLVYYKGFEYLVEAMRGVQARLLLIGDGPLRARLEALAEEKGVADRVTLLGTVQNEDITPYYHAADLFVLPSVARSEAFGIVQLEAMAAGKPVINTELDSGVPFVSPHGETGLTVPPENPPALATAINRLLSDRALRFEYGRAARARVQNLFTVQEMTSHTVDIYRDIVLERKPSQPTRTRPAAVRAQGA
jgi:rhamnosyl/mannosyltransferase